MDEESRRWLCYLYNCRGIIGPALWDEFASFCEARALIDEPVPGADVLTWIKQGAK